MRIYLKKNCVYHINIEVLLYYNKIILHIIILFSTCGNLSNMHEKMNETKNVLKHNRNLENTLKLELNANLLLNITKQHK